MSGEIRNDDYSWFKVHAKNLNRSFKLLFLGVIKNFRRVIWHSKKDLIVEYIQILSIILLLMIFCFIIFTVISAI